MPTAKRWTVADLERALGWSFAGTYPVPVGEYVPVSVAAEPMVRAAQRSLGITVDGLLGPQTWVALGTLRSSASIQRTEPGRSCTRRALDCALDHRRTQRRIMGALLTAMFAGVSLGRWLSRVREGAQP